MNGPLAITGRRLARLGQLSALDDGVLDHLEGAEDRMRSVLRVDLRPELAPDVLEALTAAASPDDIDLPAGEIPWTSPALMFTDTWTNEGRPNGGRLFEHAGAGHGELPLPLMVQRVTSAMGGHDGATSGGRIDSIDLSTAGPIPATGVFADTDDGRAAAWDYAQGYLSGVSVDLRITGYELDYITEVDDDGEEWIVDADFRATAWEIMGATGTPFPAFADARLEVALPASEREPVSEPTPDPVAASGSTYWAATAQAGTAWTPNATTTTPWTPNATTTTLGVTSATPSEGALLAAAAALRPDPSAFDLPTERVPWTVADGRLSGYLAFWHDDDGGQACHIGFADECVCPPRSETGYARFMLREIECADGSLVPVGPLTLRGGHADRYATEAEALRHYDDTDSIAAWVTVAENEHGIAIAGIVQPGLSDADLLALSLASPSGDWRPYPPGRAASSLELCAVSMVPVPGFPLVASGLPHPHVVSRNGEVVSITAAGAAGPARLKAEALAAETPVTRAELDAALADLRAVDERLARLEAMTDGMEPEARARLLARLTA